MEVTPTIPTCPVQQTDEGVLIVRVLAAVLDRLVSTNASIAHTDPGQITKFHAIKPPAIGIQQYLERIHKYAACSTECFILALIYIDRLIQRNNFLLTELNVHRVVVTAILLAAKFFDDAYYNNAYYAKVGGVLVSEMNGLEVDFLFRINFSLHFTPEVFAQYRAELLSQATPATTTAANTSGDMSPVSVISTPPHHHVHQTMIVEPVCIEPELVVQQQDTLVQHATSIVASQIAPPPPNFYVNPPPVVYPRCPEPFVVLDHRIYSTGLAVGN